MQQDPASAQPAAPGSVPDVSATTPVGSHGDAAALQQMGFDHLLHNFDVLGLVVFVVLVLMSVMSWYYIVINMAVVFGLTLTMRGLLVLRRNVANSPTPSCVVGIFSATSR